MKRLYNIGLFLILNVTLLTSLLISCSDTGTSPKDQEFKFPDSGVSFEQHVKPMFEAKCSFKNGCHEPGNINNALNYTVLMNRNQLVLHRLESTGEMLIDLNNDPDNPEESRLYLILTVGYPFEGDFMPPDDALYSGELKGIKQWISEGAPE